jgi:hypothetical protein
MSIETTRKARRRLHAETFRHAFEALFLMFFPAYHVFKVGKSHIKW